MTNGNDLKSFKKLKILDERSDFENVKPIGIFLFFQKKNCYSDRSLVSKKKKTQQNQARRALIK